jgi:hypothetical protein
MQTSKEDFEKQVEKCKQAVIMAYEGQPTTQRKWLEAHCDSYRNPDYRVQLFVLEGSPPKGCVVVDYGHGVVLAFDAHGKKLKQLKLGYMPI